MKYQKFSFIGGRASNSLQRKEVYKKSFRKMLALPIMPKLVH